MARKHTPPKPKREQVERWLLHGLPELAETASRESYWLQQGTASWRFNKRRLEYFSPVRDWIDPRALPLLEQLFRYRPQLEKLADLHDGLVAALEKAASAAASALVADEAFRHAVREANARYQQNRPSVDRWWFGHASDEELQTGLAAECVINKVAADDVPQGYAHAAFWQAEGEALLAFRRAARHQAVFAELDEAVRRLAAADGDLQAAADADRAKLADSFGLPAALL